MKSQKKCKLIVFVFICSFFATNVEAQVRIGDINPPNEQAVLELLSVVEASGSTGAKGLLLPRVRLVAADDATPFKHLGSSANSADSLYVGMMVYNLGQASSPLNPGIYFWNGKQWEASGVSSAWFYMPSTTFEMEKGSSHTKNLYQVYASQFSLPAGTTRSPSAPAIILNLPAADDFNYYIIGHSEDLFSSVSIDANGMMTYTIDDNAIVDDETYINIVFVKKYH
jgi:hypothetical protein